MFLTYFLSRKKFSDPEKRMLSKLFHDRGIQIYSVLRAELQINT